MHLTLSVQVKIMSDYSEESIGLCLSEDKTKLTMSEETGEARSNKSVSVESLSLTKISAANTGIFTSEHQPILITLPLEEEREKPAQTFEMPPNFLSVSHHNTSTSGVTPSATTLEGTLDDIPDFQEMLPLTSVVVTKKDHEINENMSPETSPAKDSNHNLSLSPPSAIPINAASKEKYLASESKFMQEVKRQNTTKPTSSIKSFASTTAPKTSTSGITVVEVKPPLRQDGRFAESDNNKQTNPDHSIGSIKSDTTRNISASISCTSLSSRLSEMTVFQAFNPEWSLTDRPFLLHMPNEDEFDSSDKYHSEQNSRKVLGDLKTSSNNRKVKPVKSWDALEIKSRAVSPKISTLSSQSSSSHDTTSHKRKKRHVVNYMNESGIKQIVKEEMTAVVSMQNEIWHRILDSFVDKALKNSGEHAQNKSFPEKSPSKELVMLQLPNEEPEAFYKPLSIPIVQSGKSTHGPVLLNLPAEDDEIDKTLVLGYDKDECSVTGEPLQKILQFDASIQTQLPTPKIAQFVEVGIQSDAEVEPILAPEKSVDKTNENENFPMRTNMMKPPRENLEYLKAINKQEIPYKVMEECKMLLESIQNSANELKEINRDSDREPKKGLKESTGENVNAKAGDKPGPYIKSKHEIFLEKFFDDDSNKKEKKASRFLDIIDLPQGTSYSGHFDLLRRSSITKKPSEFIHSIDVYDTKADQSTKKRLKVKDIHGGVHKTKAKQKSKQRKSTKSGDFHHDGLCTKDIFAPKKEIPRSPTPHSPSSPRPNPPETPNESIPQCPPSPGEVSEYKSHSLSSIGKYLSQKDEEGLSFSNQTLDDVEQPISKSDEMESEVSSKHSDTIAFPKYHSLPEENAVGSISCPGSNTGSKSSSEPHQPKAINPSQFSQFIEDNLSKIKQAYNENHKKDADRTKKISMLLLNRDSNQSIIKPKSEVTKPTPVRPSSRIKTETVTLIKPPKIIMEPRSAQPEGPSLIRRSSKVSVLSSDTSLPTNTEELLRAALDSDSSLPPDTKPTKLPTEKPQKQTVQKKSAHKHVSIEVTSPIQLNYDFAYLLLEITCNCGQRS